MTKVLGLDVGYSHTKDSELHNFRSAYTRDSVAIGKKLIIDGVNFQVGSGIMTSETDKTNAEINKVCTIYDLVCTNTQDVILSVGLPVAQYKVQKHKLKQSIMEYNKCQVQYDNREYKVQIKDVLVNPQGISSLYSLEGTRMDGEIIVVDIGGLTIDTSLIEFSTLGSKILKYDTWFKGIRTLYSDIISETNNTYGTKLENIYAETILKNGFIKVKGNVYKLDYLKPILQNYIDQITEELKLKYPYETCPFYLTGGGAGLLANSFAKRFNDVNCINNGQYANAIGYERIANYKYRGC